MPWHTTSNVSLHEKAKTYSHGAHTVIVIAKDTILHQIGFSIYYFRASTSVTGIHHNSTRIDGIGHDPSNNAISAVRSIFMSTSELVVVYGTTFVGSIDDDGESRSD